MSAITEEPRSASIIAKGSAVIKRFPGNKLSEVIEKYPDVAKHLFGVIANRLSKADQIIETLINERNQRR
jgi:type IV pilus assembly protein PilB